MNGVTGRMGTNQHLERSLLAIIAQGGVKISARRSRLCHGRSWWDATAAKLEALARDHGDLPWTTDLDAALDESAILHLFRRADHRSPRGVRAESHRSRASTSIARNRARAVWKRRMSFINSPKKRE